MAPEQAGRPSEVDRAAAEIEWWLLVVRGADAIHEQLPPPVRAEIDAGASPRELSRMALPLADLSSPTRRRIETTLQQALAALRRDRLSPPAARPHLQVAAPAAD